jgi:hypothetical protein
MYGVLRGGSWNNTNTNNFRASYRNNNTPANNNNNNAFRQCIDNGAACFTKHAGDNQSTRHDSSRCGRKDAQIPKETTGW